MKTYFTGKTDPGLVRSTNQDAYHIDPAGRFFIVSDGMGGHAGGEEASRIASDTVRGHLEAHWDSGTASRELLEQAMFKANQAIIAAQLNSPALATMGTTTVVLAFREQPWCANVGDSRIYRLRGAALEQITEDQTWVARAIRLGDLTPEEARVHPKRHILTQCLGRQTLAQVEILSLDLQKGDRWLLCSDGLTEELSDQVIENHINSTRSCELAAAALINAAREHGGRNNITVVLVAVAADDPE